MRASLTRKEEMVAVSLRVTEIIRLVAMDI